MLIKTHIRSRLKSNMTSKVQQKYIKSFSKGQIKVPKAFRDHFGLGDEFWLKLYVGKNKIVAEPMDTSYSSGDYSEELLGIKW